MSPDRPLSEVRVREIMSTRLVTVPGETTALQVAKMMEQGGIGAVLVKDDYRTDAIVTDRDYAIKIAVNRMSLETPVKSVASSPLITIGPDDTVAAATKIMVEKKIRKLAVKEGDSIIGIITSTNIVGAVSG